MQGAPLLDVAFSIGALTADKTAVAFGRTRTFVAGFVLFTVSYGYLVLLAVRDVIPRPLMLTGILYPAHLYWSCKTWGAGLTFRSISLLRARYRLLFAIIGVSMLAALLLAR
jgi:hypothetical protein